MITKPKKKETKTYLALIVIGIALLIGCPPSSSGPITKSVPPAGETDFPANGNIVLTYSGTVVKGTGNITITLAQGLPVTIDVTDAAVESEVNTTAQPVTTTVTIPASETNLVVGTVTVAIPAGAFKVTNADGADVAAYSLSFTAIAADDSPPTITKRVPAHLATDVALNANIVLTFDEVVLAGSGMITFAQSGCCSNVVIDVTSSQVTIDGKVVTINPEEDFTTQIIYNAEIHAGTFVNYAGLSDEQDGSVVATHSTWVFTTAAP